jgi:hypothetical protein
MVSVITNKQALELQKIVKETTGRKISITDAYALWNYIIKFITFFWKIRNKTNKKQKKLFNKIL